MAKNEIPLDVVCTAILKLANYLVDYNIVDHGWPEDDWIGISEDYDLNIWYNHDIGYYMATIYPVKSTQTVTTGMAWNLIGIDKSAWEYVE
jgi:hypothetical protein